MHEKDKKTKRHSRTNVFKTNNEFGKDVLLVSRWNGVGWSRGGSENFGLGQLQNQKIKSVVKKCNQL